MRRPSRHNSGYLPHNRSINRNNNSSNNDDERNQRRQKQQKRLMVYMMLMMTMCFVLVKASFFSANADAEIINMSTRASELGVESAKLGELINNLHEVNEVLSTNISHYKVEKGSPKVQEEKVEKYEEDTNVSVLKTALQGLDVLDVLDVPSTPSTTGTDTTGAEISSEATKEIENKKISIFFNTYQNPENPEQGNDIIIDQIRQINNQQLLTNSTIYYNRFGDYKTNEFPKATCENNNSRNCFEYVAQKEGDEQLTLQHLHDYCVANKDDRVVYIHTKGAFTPSKENDILRNILMKAVTSPQCLEMNTFTDTGGRCDTCSTQFHGLPAHYPGNMWVANCDYVSKLIPPNVFEQKKQSLRKNIKDAAKPIINTKKLKAIMSSGISFEWHKSKSWMLDSPSMLGIERFAMEQWVGSHPGLHPCDVFSPKDKVPIFRYGTTEEKGINATTLTPVLRIAPGMGFKDFWKEKKFALHPWFKKNGRIYEYNKLYGEQPSPSSWFHLFWNH